MLLKIIKFFPQHILNYAKRRPNDLVMVLFKGSLVNAEFIP